MGSAEIQTAGMQHATCLACSIACLLMLQRRIECCTAESWEPVCASNMRETDPSFISTQLFRQGGGDGCENNLLSLVSYGCQCYDR